MSKTLRCALTLALLAAGALAQERLEQDEKFWRPWHKRETGPHRGPGALHLSTFDSMLAGRVDQDGAIDSGAGVLRFYNGTTGEPLAATGLRYGFGFHFWSTYYDELDGAFVSVRTVAWPTGPDADRRVALATRVAFENPTDSDAEVHLVAKLFAGDDDPDRPAPSLTWSEAEAFEYDGTLVSRNGAPLLYAEGGQMVAPTVTLHEPVGPDDPICTLEWTVPVRSREARTAAVHLAGPSSAESPDEAAFRESFERFTYPRLEEMSDWQSGVRPVMVRNSLGPGNERLGNAMYSAIHFGRVLSDAEEIIEELTDRPFSRPASDATIRPTYLGLFTEWGLADFALEPLREMAEGAREAAADLSPQQRVAYLDGLTRAVRLLNDSAMELALAEAYAELLTEPAAVPVWSDPGDVRAAFADILTRAGVPEQVEALPELSWAEAEEGSPAGLMIAARKALAAKDPVTAWTQMQALLDMTSIDGLGSMDGPEGDFDARFGIGLMSVARAFLLDDYGEDLVLLPGNCTGLMPRIGKLKMMVLNSRFGAVQYSVYWGRLNKVVGGSIGFIPMPWRLPRDVLLCPPRPYKMHGVQVQKGGKVQTRKDGMLVFTENQQRAVSFNASARLPR